MLIVSCSKIIPTKGNLKGNVSFIMESEYLAKVKCGKIKKSKLLSKTTYKFDKKRKIIGKIDYNEESLHRHWNFKYDKNENLIEENCYNSKKRLEYNWVYKYNKKGKIIKKSLSNYGRLRCKSFYQYSKKGN